MKKREVIIALIVVVVWFTLLGIFAFRVIRGDYPSKGYPIAQYYTYADGFEHMNVRSPDDVNIDVYASGYRFEYYEDHIDLILRYERVDYPKE